MANGPELEASLSSFVSDATPDNGLEVVLVQFPPSESVSYQQLYPHIASVGKPRACIMAELPHHQSVLHVCALLLLRIQTQPIPANAWDFDMLSGTINRVESSTWALYFLANGKNTFLYQHTLLQNSQAHNDESDRMGRHSRNNERLYRHGIARNVQNGDLPIHQVAAVERGIHIMNRLARTLPVFKEIDLVISMPWLSTFASHGRIVERLNLSRSEGIRGLWLRGRSGSGKTYQALHFSYPIYVIPRSGVYFPNFHNEPLLLYNEFYPGDLSAAFFIDLMEGIPQNAKYESSVTLTHHAVIVTSNSSLMDAVNAWGLEGQERTAIFRRFKEVVFNEGFPTVRIAPPALQLGNP